MKKSVVFFILLFFYAIPTSAENIKIEHLLDKMIKAYGGEANLKKLYTYKQTWKLHSVVSDEDGFDNRSVALPDKLRVELSYFTHNEHRILNKENGLKIHNRATKEKVKSPALDAMKLQRMRLYHPLLLKNRKANSSVITNDDFHVISLTENNLLTNYYINPTTFMIDIVIGHLNAGGMSMEFKTLYSDFRKIDGVVLPHQEKKFAGATNTAVLNLKKTALLEKHAGNLFKVD